MLIIWNETLMAHLITTPEFSEKKKELQNLLKYQSL
jgi:hypothetical protein